MNVFIDYRVAKFIKRLNSKDSSRVLSYIELFEKHGFSLGSNHLKKVNSSTWELRPGKIRLFIFIKSKNQVIIHAIHKKSQKITKKDMKTIISRQQEYV